MKERWGFFFIFLGGFFFSAAAAHDAAKINSSRGIDVRLARTGGQLGAQCVERKQAPRQGAASTQLRPGTGVSLSFGASTAFPHACFAMLLMTAIVVALQSQHTLASRSLAATTQRLLPRHPRHVISGQMFSEGGGRGSSPPRGSFSFAIGCLFCRWKNNAAGCCEATVGNRFARGRTLTVNKFTHEQ